MEGERYYRISGYDIMPPFLMSIPSDTDIWIFISSAGGLTAGRVDAEGSLFPYETVDKLHDAHHHTGPVTLLRVRQENGAVILWHPFAANAADPSTTAIAMGTQPLSISRKMMVAAGSAERK